MRSVRHAKRRLTWTSLKAQGVCIAIQPPKHYKQQSLIRLRLTFIAIFHGGYDEVMRLTNNSAASRPAPSARTCKLPESDRESTKDEGAASVRG